MARTGYVTATKNGVTREFSELCWNALGSNKQGWRLIESDQVKEVEITEKKKSAEALVNVAEESDAVPGFENEIPAPVEKVAEPVAEPAKPVKQLAKPVNKGGRPKRK